VDFVVKEGMHVTQLIQVCINIDDPKTKARELRALLKASVELNCKNLLVLTESVEGEEETSWFGLRGTVRFLPLRHWLLEAA
jgi:predicted AAA+ superfamily ATPase